MTSPFQNSDASYDARTSILNDHLNALEDESIRNVDNDYLNFVRLVTGQTATQENSRALESDVAGNDLGNSSDSGCVMPAGHENIQIDQSFNETDSDVEVLDSAAVMEQRIPNSFVPSTSHVTIPEDGDAQAVDSASAMEFRSRVMTVLTKPFNEDEYGELSKLFKDGAYYRSYPDVGKKLTDCRRRKEKRLNVLRGFFFWLQKVVTQEGSFKPWEDSECLAV